MASYYGDARSFSWVETPVRVVGIFTINTLPAYFRAAAGVGAPLLALGFIYKKRSTATTMQMPMVTTAPTTANVIEGSRLEPPSTASKYNGSMQS